MRRRSLVATAAALAWLSSPLAAVAQGADLVAFGLGAFSARHDTEAQFRLDYRVADTVLWIFKPLAGASVAANGTFFAYAGARVEVSLAEHVVLMGDGAAGYWRHGRGLDLGNALEFKTGAELAWRFADESRLGVAFDHVSNAGIAKLNPGVESLLLVYSVPLGRWR